MPVGFGSAGYSFQIKPIINTDMLKSGFNKVNAMLSFTQKYREIKLRLTVGKVDMEQFARLREEVGKMTGNLNELSGVSRKAAKEQVAATTSYMAMARTLEKGKVNAKSLMDSMSSMLDMYSSEGAKRRKFLAEQTGKSQRELESMLYERPAKMSLELMQQVSHILRNNINFQRMSNSEIQKQIQLNQKNLESVSGITMEREDALRLAKMTNKEFEKSYKKQYKDTTKISDTYDKTEKKSKGIRSALMGIAKTILPILVIQSLKAHGVFTKLGQVAKTVGTNIGGKAWGMVRGQMQQHPIAKHFVQPLQWAGRVMPGLFGKLVRVIGAGRLMILAQFGAIAAAVGVMAMHIYAEYKEMIDGMVTENGRFIDSYIGLSQVLVSRGVRYGVENAKEAMQTLMKFEHGNVEQLAAATDQALYLSKALGIAAGEAGHFVGQMGKMYGLNTAQIDDAGQSIMNLRDNTQMTTEAAMELHKEIMEMTAAYGRVGGAQARASKSLMNMAAVLEKNYISSKKFIDTFAEMEDYFSPEGMQKRAMFASALGKNTDEMWQMITERPQEATVGMMKASRDFFKVQLKGMKEGTAEYRRQAQWARNTFKSLYGMELSEYEINRLMKLSNKELESEIKSMATLKQQHDAIISSWSNLVIIIKGALMPVLLGVGGVLTKAIVPPLKVVADIFYEIGKLIGDFFAELEDTGVFKVWQKMWDNVGTAIKKVVLSPAFAAMKVGFKIMFLPLKGAMWLMEKVFDLVGGVVDKIGSAYEFIAGIYNDIRGMLDWLSPKKWFGGGTAAKEEEAVPAMQAGGTIDKEGLAYLHKGETVVPAKDFVYTLGGDRLTKAQARGLKEPVMTEAEFMQFAKDDLEEMEAIKRKGGMVDQDLYSKIKRMYKETKVDADREKGLKDFAEAFKKAKIHSEQIKGYEETKKDLIEQGVIPPDYGEKKPIAPAAAGIAGIKGGFGLKLGKGGFGVGVTAGGGLNAGGALGGFGIDVGVGKGGVRAGLTAIGTVTETKAKAEEEIMTSERERIKQDWKDWKTAREKEPTPVAMPTPAPTATAPLLDPSIARAMAHGAPAAPIPKPTIPEIKKPEAPAAAPHIELNQGEVVGILREIRELLKRQVNVTPGGRKIRTATDDMMNNAYI